MSKLLWKDGKLQWKTSNLQWIPTGSVADDCDCCGGGLCFCSDTVQNAFVSGTLQVTFPAEITAWESTLQGNAFTGYYRQRIRWQNYSAFSGTYVLTPANNTNTPGTCSFAFPTVTGTLNYILDWVVCTGGSPGTGQFGCPTSTLYNPDPSFTPVASAPLAASFNFSVDMLGGLRRYGFGLQTDAVHPLPTWTRGDCGASNSSTLPAENYCNTYPTSGTAYPSNIVGFAQEITAGGGGICTSTTKVGAPYTFTWVVS